MKQFLVTVAGVVVGLLLFAIAAPVILIGVAALVSRPSPPPARTVLVLDLRGGLTDQPSDGPLAFLRGRGLSVIGIEETLRRAETDDRVKGLFVRLPEGGMAPAAADELRLAFKRFRAAGKPIIATDGGALPEIVLPGETGLLVPMGNAVAMADAIRELLSHPEQAMAMGDAGRLRVRRRFTISHTARRLEDIYDFLLEPLKSPTVTALWPETGQTYRS